MPFSKLPPHPIPLPQGRGCPENGIALPVFLLGSYALFMHATPGYTGRGRDEYQLFGCVFGIVSLRSWIEDLGSVGRHHLHRLAEIVSQ
jgi:hypothetical protein